MSHLFSKKLFDRDLSIAYVGANKSKKWDEISRKTKKHKPD